MPLTPSSWPVRARSNRTPRRGDIALRADLLLLDDDARDHRRSSAESGRPGAWPSGRPWVLAQSAFQPLRWAWRQPSSRAFSAVSARDVDLDAGDLEGAGAVDRRHAAVGAFELGVEHARADERAEASDGISEGERAAGKLHAGLLASWPWKSKRDVARRR